MIFTQENFDALHGASKNEPSFRQILQFMAEFSRNHGYLLLHVDDDMIYLQALASYLDFGGYRVMSLSNPRDAVLFLRSVRPDLIVLDYHMPLQTGQSLYAEISQMREVRGVPMVFLTAAEMERHALSPAPDQPLFLSKEDSPQELVEKFSHLIQG